MVLVLQCDAFVLVVLSDELKQSQGRVFFDRKLVNPRPHPHSSFIAGCPKAALMLWFFGVFICGVWLFIVLLVRHL